MSSSIVQVPSFSKCCFCNNAGRIDARLLQGSWGNVCVEHWVTHIYREREAPFLGTGMGQFKTLDSVQFRQAKTIQKKFGNKERYTMLIRGNRIVYTENRSYTRIEQEPDLLGCVFDIATRLLPHETDLQDGGVKVWLFKLGGKW